ncbi:MAG: histidine triad nucleotide-binding protein [Verrucomicrobia bacterium]|nr:histidine triad nucleotide-binding protein [Verrucomicrobiota bacterium]
MSTVFGLIIEGKLPCTKVYESARVLAIEDIHPVAPVHILIMPKKAIKDFQSIEPADWPIIQEMFQVAQQIAEEKGLDEEGYRLLTNNGPNAGQVVFHLHFHLIGGKVLGKIG